MQLSPPLSRRLQYLLYVKTVCMFAAETCVFFELGGLSIIHNGCKYSYDFMTMGKGECRFIVLMIHIIHLNFFFWFIFNLCILFVVVKNKSDTLVDLNAFGYYFFFSAFYSIYNICTNISWLIVSNQSMSINIIILLKQFITKLMSYPHLKQLFECNYKLLIIIL